MSNQNPNPKDILKLKTRGQVLNYGRTIKCRILEGADYIYLDSVKCVFNKAGKLLFVQ